MPDTITDPISAEPLELTRTFTVDQLEEIGLPHEGYLHAEYVTEHRWYSVWRVTFRDPADDTNWSVLRADPATERQENDWWTRYPDRNAVPRKRMELRTVTRQEWQMAAAPAMTEEV